ncbi:3-keto-5-aminohexanoate cleavage protein [Nucisporomicrobium flavum]|uniref:3-keto-5-aminohexanoate cleavage protein n=1 Tax=Nucisporomicrobium flavum TaxID=2785915 RepID=UPI0027DCA13B|nr:3-keto-5-aminohexanoate cleavage protein [Nucisporomicrobium flavum]
MIRRIKVCLNGGRRPGDHPGVPVTPAQLAEAATGAVAAGAEAVHLHPRDATGAETLDVGAAVAAVRASCPGTPVGVSTGLWITGGDARLRLERIHAWAGLPPEQRPDMASVNVHEERFADTAAAVREAGVAVEAGVWTAGAASVLGGVPVDRILIEVVDPAVADAERAADQILDRLDRLGVAGPRLLHGEEEACWPLVRHAGRLGLPTRIGLEDTLVDETGAPAVDNADLVRRALRVWSNAGQVQ